jgi:hypothetical protein
VVVVDQSHEMLGRIDVAETVLADIETLALGRRFPVVLLASNFVNDPDRSRVRAYLECCVRHVAPAGQVLIQGYPREWSPDGEWRELGGVRMRLRSFELEGRSLRGEMEYVVDGETLLHAFEALLATRHSSTTSSRQRASSDGAIWTTPAHGSKRYPAVGLSMRQGREAAVSRDLATGILRQRIPVLRKT